MEAHKILLFNIPTKKFYFPVISTYFSMSNPYQMGEASPEKSTLELHPLMNC